jgi:hypothetical protein
MTDSITCGNPRKPTILDYHRKAMTRLIDDMWQVPEMAEFRKDLEPALAEMARTGDVFDGLGFLTEFFLNAVWDDERYAEEAHEIAAHWFNIYHDQWEALYRAEIAAYKGRSA